MSLGPEKPQQFFRGTFSRRLMVSLILIGLVIYAWPVFQAPFLMDEVYGVVNIHGTDVRDSFFSIVKLSFSEELFDYFLMEQGRILPFGTLLYHTGYWITSSIAFATGMSGALVYSLFKMFFLLMSFIGLRKLLIEFAEDGLIKDTQKRMYVTNLTLLCAFVFITGLRTDLADRNGLMVYPFLTYSALLYAIWIPLILIKIRRSTFSRLAFPIAAVTFGCVIGFGYELHYCAVVTSTIALFLTRKNKKILSKSTLRDLILMFSFCVTFLFNQILIKSACANSDCYAGTKIQLGEELPSTVLHNFVGNLPLRAQSTLELYSQAAFTFEVPSTLSVRTLVSTLLISVLMLGLAYRHSLMTTSSLAVVDRRTIALKGFFTFAGLGAFIIITTSLSQLSQELLTSSVPYRGYVVAWFSISVSVTLLIFSASKTAVIPTLATILLGLVIGCYLHAWSIFGVEVVNALPKNAVFQIVISDFHSRPGIGNDDSKRCNDLEALGNSRRAKAVRKEIDSVYSHVYGEKFCSTNNFVANPTDQIINH